MELSQKEANFVDTCVNNILNAMIQSNKLVLNLNSIQAAADSAYSMALGVLSVRKKYIEIKE